MPNKFTIDININGAEGSSSEPRGTQGAQGAAARSSLGAGAAAGYAMSGKMSDFGKSPNEFKYAERNTTDTVKTTERELGMRFQGSKLHAMGRIREMQWSDPIEGKGSTHQQTMFGAATNKMGLDPVLDRINAKQVGTLGVAAAWKGTSTALDLKNYKSGDSYANQQRDNAMRMATMGAAFAATGFNPAIGAALVGNEAISAYSDYQKYTFDRKMESQEIFNIKQIAGDVSYGINRRGGF